MSADGHRYAVIEVGCLECGTATTMLSSHWDHHSAMAAAKAKVQERMDQDMESSYLVHIVDLTEATCTPVTPAQVVYGWV